MPEATPATAPQKLLIEEGGSLEAHTAEFDGGGLDCALEGVVGGGSVKSGLAVPGAWLLVLVLSDVGPDILSMIGVPY